MVAADGGLVTPPHEERPRRSALPALIVATIACYAIGYPLALVAGNGFGWVLVSLGGVLLLVIGVDVIRRIARSDR